MQHCARMSVFAFVCPKQSVLTAKTVILMTNMLNDSWMSFETNHQPHRKYKVRIKCSISQRDVAYPCFVATVKLANTGLLGFDKIQMMEWLFEE